MGLPLFLFPLSNSPEILQRDFSFLANRPHCRSLLVLFLNLPVSIGLVRVGYYSEELAAFDNWSKEKEGKS